MKKILSILITLLTLLLSLPTVLVLASWNSLPGDSIYPVKIGLEKIAAGILRNTYIERQLQVGFAERRFSEADRLLVEQKSTIGFALLIAQAETAKEEIVKAQDVGSKEKLVTNLTNYQQKLEERKVEIESRPQAPPTTVIPTRQPASPLPAEKPKPSPTPTASVSPSAPETVATIEQTQEKLEEIKKELEKEVKKPAKEEEKHEKQENRQEKKEESHQEKSKPGKD